MLAQDKECPNCHDKHSGMFILCYPCFDSETEYEFESRTCEVKPK